MGKVQVISKVTVLVTFLAEATSAASRGLEL